MSRAGRTLRTLAFVLRLAVTGGVLAVVLWRFGPQRMLGTVSRADPLWLAAAIVLAGAQLAVVARRWQIVFERLIGLRPGLWRMVYLSGQSMLFGQFLPSSLGADVIRAGALARDGGLLAAARSVICDRLLGLFALLLIVAALLPYFQGPASHMIAAFWSLAALSLGGLAAFAALAFLPGALERIPLAGRFLAASGADFRSVLAPRHGGGLVLLSLLGHFLSIGLFVVILRGIGGGLSLYECVIVPAALLVSMVPISLSGWGVREAVIASGFAMIGADPVAGATASVLFGLTVPLCGGITELFGALVPPARAALVDRR